MTVLLLDVMGTLVRDPFFEDVPAFFGLSFAELLAQKSPAGWIEFELGQWDESTLLQRYFRDGRAIDGQAFQAMLRRGYRWLEGMEALLRELHAAGVAMHTLSNYGPWYRLIDDELGLSRFLAWSFVSCELGVRKPDPEAYLEPARRLKVAPGDCLFVDDRAANCAGAEAVGMPALRFQDAASLRAELVARQLLG